MAKIACLVGPEFEDSELAFPVKRLQEAGHEVEMIGTEGGKELGGKRGKEKVTTDAAVNERRPDQYDALLIPGGHSPDHLRVHHDVVQFVREFAGTGRPIATICHGPQLLIEAGVVAGKKMTSWPSVRTDLKNAGAEVVDEEVVEDGSFITSRGPDDLEAFSGAILERLHGGEQMEAASPTEMERPQPGA
ncbi:MAG TPA: type 1 glutamine amidotransferase domain-containing protein [Kofleriaceae bacterium]|nr:type 1 glutamine amidotransferase domain-containing protein [Kofleriaceae bacterium]